MPWVFPIIIIIIDLTSYYKSSNIFNQINIIINIIILLLIIYDFFAKAYEFNGIIEIYIICIISSFIIDLYNFIFSYYNIVKNICFCIFTLVLYDSLKKKRECMKERNNLKNYFVFLEFCKFLMLSKSSIELLFEVSVNVKEDPIFIIIIIIIIIIINRRNIN